MQSLVLTEKETVAKEVQKAKEEHQVDEKVNEKAVAAVQEILAVNTRDLETQQKTVGSVSSLGEAVAKEISKQSAMLRQPMANLVENAQDGGPVANSLISLQEQVNVINPNRVDFTMSTLRRLLAKIPGVGTPVSRWFARYQSVEGVINDIVKSLESGKVGLERDNKILEEDIRRLRTLSFVLQDYITLGQAMDQKLGEALSRLTDDMQKKFLEEEVLFSLRQRVMDLQQLLAVAYQGAISLEVLRQNNKQLIRGVDRAVNVTVTALSTASTLALGLAAQKRVLKGVEAVTNTTNELIVDTAKQLRTQGVEIQKRSAEAMLDVQKLKEAFNEMIAAIDDVAEFRRNALPKMIDTIGEMNNVNHKMEEKVAQTEKAKEVSLSLEDVFELTDSTGAK